MVENFDTILLHICTQYSFICLKTLFGAHIFGGCKKKPHETETHRIVGSGS